MFRKFEKIAIRWIALFTFRTSDPRPNAELAVAPLFWAVNCKKYGGYVALLSGPSGYLLFCDVALFLGARRGKGDSSARRAYRNTASINY